MSYHVTDNLKILGSAYKRDDFTTEAFFAYWRDVHGPLGAAIRCPLLLPAMMRTSAKAEASVKRTVLSSTASIF